MHGPFSILSKLFFKDCVKYTSDITMSHVSTSVNCVSISMATLTHITMVSLPASWFPEFKARLIHIQVILQSVSFSDRVKTQNSSDVSFCVNTYLNDTACSVLQWLC